VQPPRVAFGNVLAGLVVVRLAGGRKSHQQLPRSSRNSNVSRSEEFQLADTMAAD
jgi:hypothetical protein